MKLEYGLHRDIDNDRYHSDRQFISSSGLKLMLNDPVAFYRRYVTNEDTFKGSDAMDLGTYVHTLVLEPEDEDTYVFFDGKRQSGSKKWEKFQEENKDKFILPRSAKQKGFYCAKSVKEDKFSQDLLSSGEAEITLCVDLMDVPVKVRFDWLGDCHITDLKTSYKCDGVESIEEIILDRDYDLSAALYCDAFERERGIAPKFSFIFVNTTNFKVFAVDASEEMIENGRRKYKCALKKLKKARKTGLYLPDSRPVVTVAKEKRFYDRS